MKSMKKTTLLFLFLITLLAAFLRLYRLDKFPPSLFGDEVDVGYQAYSILKTGKDYLGQRWPVSFHSLADWRTPLFLYADVPFIAAFGLNEWGVRLPAAFFGIATIPFFFLLVRKLFKDDNLSLAAAFFLAISMWHLQYSRAAFEVTQMLFLLIAGLYFFLKGLESWPYLFASVVFLALSPYSYNTAKLFLPLLFLLLLIIFRNEVKRIPFKRVLLPVVFFAAILSPMAKDIFFGQGGNRFSILSIFTDPTVVPQIGFDRQVDMRVSLGREVPVGTSPSFFSRIFHNKFLYWGLSLVQNYFRVFSTDFLFTGGDINLRHSVQGGFGELWWLDAVFLILGIFSLPKLKEAKTRKLIFGWLFLSPIPSVLTRDGGNHATRLILILPPLLILTSFGFYNFLGRFKNFNKKMTILFLLLTSYFLLLTLYLHRYYIHYPLESEEWWHYGYREMADYVQKNEGKYDYIVFSDRDQPPLIFSLFWLKIDPRIPQQNKLVWTQISDAIWADHLPGTKYYYGHVSEERIKANGFVGTLKPNILYLMPEVEMGKDFRREPVPNSVNLLETIYFPSGRIAKYILTGK